MKSITLIVIFSILILQCSLFSNPENFPTWEITVNKGINLWDSDIGRKNITDAYIIVYAAEPLANKKYHVTEIGRTTVKMNTKNPIWNYKINFSPKNHHEDTNYFYFRLWDRDPKFKNDQLFGGFLHHYTHNREFTRAMDGNARNMINLPKSYRSTFRHIGGILISIKKIPPKTTVPNLIGKTLSEARQIIKDSKLNLVSYGFNPTSNIAMKGKIMIQSPSSGEKVDLNSRIRLTIGKLPSYTVPNVIGKSFFYAKKQILAKRLNIGIVNYIDCPEISKNSIVRSQSPAPSTSVKPYSNINLAVFKFKQPKPVVFPDVIGCNYKDARYRLRKAGLNVGSIRKKPVDENKGTVVETIPDRKKKPKLPPGTRVSLVMAAPEMLGTSLAFPIDKKPGEKMSLDFNKNNSYYVKITSDQNGYVKFLTAAGSVGLPLDGEFMDEELQKLGRYSNWYRRRVFKVLKGTYFMEFFWDSMTGKNKTNAIVNFHYEIVPEMDPTEPNDSKEIAPTIFTGLTTEIAIFPSGDQDWFLWEADEDGYLRINFDGSTKGLSMFEMDIFCEGKKVNSHRTPVSSVKVFKGKKYYINLRVVIGGSETPFKLIPHFISELDIYEPNDTLETATPISGDTSGSFYTQGQGEKEFFKLMPPVWAKYAVLRVEHCESLIDPRFYYGTDTKKINNWGYVKPKNNSCTIPVNGNELLYLYSWNEHHQVYSDKPIYFSIKFLKGKAKTDIGNSFENACDIGLKESPEFALAPQGDIEFFKFKIEKPGIYYFYIKNVISNELRCYLHDSSKKELARFEVRHIKTHKYDFKEAGSYYFTMRCEYGHHSSSEEMTFQVLDKLPESPEYEDVEKEIITDDSKAMDYARLALKALNEKKYTESISLFEKAIALKPDHRFYHDMGVDYYKLKKYSDAEKQFRKAIEIDSNYYLAYKSLGAVLGDQEKFQESLAAFKDAEKLKTTDASLYYNMGRTYELMHRKDNSKKEYLLKAFELTEKANKMAPGKKAVIDQLKRLKDLLKK